jgi:hypothetical protein
LKVEERILEKVVKTKEEVKLKKRRRQLCKQTTERRKKMKKAGAS